MAKNDEDFQKAVAELRKHLRSRRKESLRELLGPFFSHENELQAFLDEAMQVQEAHRMLLRLDWYVGLADLIEAVRPERAPLRLIFLLAVAESIVRTRIEMEDGKDAAIRAGSLDSILRFFGLLSEGDKQRLLAGVRRPVGDEKGVEFELDEIIRILWQARNDAAHGIDFWTFQIPNELEVAEGGLFETRLIKVF